MKKQSPIPIPRNLRHELELWEQKIRRADKHKLRQPIKKRMTSEAYAAWINSRKGGE